VDGFLHLAVSNEELGFEEEVGFDDFVGVELVVEALEGDAFHAVARGWWGHGVLFPARRWAVPHPTRS
jgi:hypothetical protein